MLIILQKDIKRELVEQNIKTENEGFWVKTVEGPYLSLQGPFHSTCPHGFLRRTRRTLESLCWDGLHWREQTVSPLNSHPLILSLLVGHNPPPPPPHVPLTLSCSITDYPQSRLFYLLHRRHRVGVTFTSPVTVRVSKRAGTRTEGKTKYMYINI